MGKDAITSLGKSVKILPCLLFHLGDVLAEASYHDSTLLYRLLKNYPSEKLRNPLTERQLAGASNGSVKVGWERPFYTRFTRWAQQLYDLVTRPNAALRNRLCNPQSGKSESWPACSQPLKAADRVQKNLWPTGSGLF
jgi:hypothetical protein